MNDPSVVAALGIEAVEWLDEAGDRVTVRISGRWRRRPTATGQPWLVVESHGERNRFPAMPEPPGLSGTAPGMWRMTFRVPSELTRAPDVRAWLQLGGVLVPLPAEPAVEPIPPALEPRSVGVFELEEAAREEQLREAERALESERARTTAAESAAADLASRVADLGHELEQREAELARLGATLADHEHKLRAARQHAHSEEMVRLELARERDRLQDMLEASRLRVEGLEDDLVALRRRADEAEHLAAAARRMRPPTPVSPPSYRRPHPTGRAGAYAAERALARLAQGAALTQTVTRLPAQPVWSVRERELVAVRTRRTVPVAGADLTVTVDALRGEMSDLRAIAEREREARGAAEALSERLRHQVQGEEARAARAFAALDELRDQIEWVRQAYRALGEGRSPVPPASASNGGFEVGRLDAARTRLREQAPALPPEEPPENAAADPRPSFTVAPIADRDPERAGRLLLALLPAQGLVHPTALAYDLILDHSTCVRVTVADEGATEVKWVHAPRARADVRFQLTGGPASIVRLLTAGALRRRLLRRRLAKVHGDRTGLDALRDLLTARLAVAELERVGVSLEDLDVPVGADSPNRATSG